MNRIIKNTVLRKSLLGLTIAVFLGVLFSRVGYTENLDTKEVPKEAPGIKNILLVGVDGENLEKGNRSDAMIIMTIDQNNKNIKLTSLCRDTYVYIKGHGKEKLTHAYAYSGPELLLDTIEKNFGIKISKYATVNFSSFINIIDLLGGVEVEVTDNDVNVLNQLIKVCYKIDTKEDKGKMELIDSAGKYNLNGYQALAFSRIRYQDSTDARNTRQRMVVKSALEKLKTKGLSTYISSLNEILLGVKTNLSPTEIIVLGYKTLRIGTDNMKTLEFPVYKEEVKLKEAGWVVIWDEEDNLDLLNNFIYESIKVE
ncbi:LytR family transcriptional regulator [Romboutsia ilealis]|uniref:LCP family protein n=1 Tax=Romboutsia faecis TaxID=2764597 RepID=A0ABR7JM61_9FIRM|nr:LCP family protein [Romboutsia faecis]MBC5995798.1 LCP family protein [Romboutsia faecis]MRN22997.1 LytR family transcriptional regulator [Romboutsia ilealis]